MQGIVHVAEDSALRMIENSGLSYEELVRRLGVEDLESRGITKENYIPKPKTEE